MKRLIKRKKMTSLLTWLLAFVLVQVLWGCGGDDEETTSSEPQQKEQSSGIPPGFKVVKGLNLTGSNKKTDLALVEDDDGSTTTINTGACNIGANTLEDPTDEQKEALRLLEEHGDDGDTDNGGDVVKESISCFCNEETSEYLCVVPVGVPFEMYTHDGGATTCSMSFPISDDSESDSDDSESDSDDSESDSDDSDSDDSDSDDSDSDDSESNGDGSTKEAPIMILEDDKFSLAQSSCGEEADNGTVECENGQMFPEESSVEDCADDDFVAAVKKGVPNEDTVSALTDEPLAGTLMRYFDELTGEALCNTGYCGGSGEARNGHSDSGDRQEGKNEFNLVLSDDFDGDGYEDEYDNCPEQWNDDQMDSDGDGVGDLCDSDSGDYVTEVPEYYYDDPSSNSETQVPDDSSSDYNTPVPEYYDDDSSSGYDTPVPVDEPKNSSDSSVDHDKDNTIDEENDTDFKNNVENFSEGEAFEPQGDFMQGSKDGAHNSGMMNPEQMEQMQNMMQENFNHDYGHFGDGFNPVICHQAGYTIPKHIFDDFARFGMGDGDFDHEFKTQDAKLSFKLDETTCDENGKPLIDGENCLMTISATTKDDEGNEEVEVYPDLIFTGFNNTFLAKGAKEVEHSKIIEDALIDFARDWMSKREDHFVPMEMPHFDGHCDPLQLMNRIRNYFGHDSYTQGDSVHFKPHFDHGGFHGSHHRQHDEAQSVCSEAQDPNDTPESSLMNLEEFCIIDDDTNEERDGTTRTTDDFESDYAANFYVDPTEADDATVLSGQDSDRDGVVDQHNNLVPTEWETGRDNSFGDDDGDGTLNWLDLYPFDGDIATSLVDAFENYDEDQGGDSLYVVTGFDDDGDGIPNERDIWDYDTDGDGTVDGDDDDLDGDDIEDWNDYDDDTDGVSLADDSCPYTDNWGSDTDGDGIDDACDNCVNESNEYQEDHDNDGVGDACEDELEVNWDSHSVADRLVWSNYEWFRGEIMGILDDWNNTFDYSDLANFRTDFIDADGDQIPDGDPDVSSSTFIDSCVDVDDVQGYYYPGDFDWDADESALTCVANKASGSLKQIAARAAERLCKMYVNNYRVGYDLDIGDDGWCSTEESDMVDECYARTDDSCHDDGCWWEGWSSFHRDITYLKLVGIDLKVGQWENDAWLTCIHDPDSCNQPGEEPNWNDQPHHFHDTPLQDADDAVDERKRGEQEWASEELERIHYDILECRDRYSGNNGDLTKRQANISNILASVNRFKDIKTTNGDQDKYICGEELTDAEKTSCLADPTNFDKIKGEDCPANKMTRCQYENVAQMLDLAQDRAQQWKDGLNHTNNMFNHLKKAVEKASDDSCLPDEEGESLVFEGTEDVEACTDINADKSIQNKFACFGDAVAYDSTNNIKKSQERSFNHLRCMELDKNINRAREVCMVAPSRGKDPTLDMKSKAGITGDAGVLRLAQEDKDCKEDEFWNHYMGVCEKEIICKLPPGVTTEQRTQCIDDVLANAKILELPGETDTCTKVKMYVSAIGTRTINQTYIDGLKFSEGDFNLTFINMQNFEKEDMLRQLLEECKIQLEVVATDDTGCWKYYTEKDGVTTYSSELSTNCTDPDTGETITGCKLSSDYTETDGYTWQKEMEIKHAPLIDVVNREIIKVRGSKVKDEEGGDSLEALMNTQDAMKEAEDAALGGQ